MGSVTGFSIAGARRGTAPISPYSLAPSQVCSPAWHSAFIPPHPPATTLSAAFGHKIKCSLFFPMLSCLFTTSQSLELLHIITDPLFIILLLYHPLLSG